VSTGIFNEVNVVCQSLSKPLCDQYQRGFSFMEGIFVTDAPCFFNGAPDSVILECASLSSINGESCVVIKTNDLVREGDEKYCDNASSVFGLLYDCQWTEGHDGGWGSCGGIYYLSIEGMLFVRLLS
jgi:hypothetical protein